MYSSNQLALAIDSEFYPAPSKPRKAKPHHRPRIDGPLLPLASPRFLPVVGVPKTRGDCPSRSDGFCPHVMCRFHLFLEDAEHRAGRPGLRQVPRDSKGLTVSQPGSAGTERAGTTLAPRWLRIRDEPAEAERCCPAWLWFDDNGVPEVNVDPVRWAYMRVRPGDALDIVNRVDDLRVTWARVGQDGESLAFDEMPPRYDSMFIWIVRKRLIQSCALDVVDQHGGVSNEDTGLHIGRHRTLVARVVRRALGKLKAAGVDLRDVIQQQEEE